MTSTELFNKAVKLVQELAIVYRSHSWESKSDAADELDEKAQKAIKAYEAATGNDFWEDFNCEEEGL